MTASNEIRLKLLHHRRLSDVDQGINVKHNNFTEMDKQNLQFQIKSVLHAFRELNFVRFRKSD